MKYLLTLIGREGGMDDATPEEIEGGWTPGGGSRRR